MGWEIFPVKSCLVVLDPSIAFLNYSGKSSRADFSANGEAFGFMTGLPRWQIRGSTLRIMKPHIWLLAFVWISSLSAEGIPAMPPELAGYTLVPAPKTPTQFLKKGDRLAICGDSITEQKRYSVLLETYLTACYPDIDITCRQYGWSGETSGGFVDRMKSDVLRFQPMIATTCYGMNDFRYVPYDEAIAAEYRKNQTAVIDEFQGIGCRVVLGSPTIIDSVPHWVKTAKGTQQDLNLCLSQYRNIDVEIANSKNTAFADNYTPMLLADFAAKNKFGPDFKVAGKDGVHPGWAGCLIMTYSFLKGLGVDGDIGSVTYDEGSGKATVENGHEVMSTENGKITIRSTRLLFSPGPGATDNADSIPAGLALVPFDDELNRFLFRITSPIAKNYTITWGEQSRTYSAEQLIEGINLAKDFDNNPLVPAFKAICTVVSYKQAYETFHIQKMIHGPEGTADLDATLALTEKVHGFLEKAILAEKKPAVHSITVAAVR